MMQLLEIRSLSAPNVWAHVPVMECKVVCDPVPHEQISRLFERLHRLPRSTLPFEHRQYASAADAMVELALELQRQADCPVEFSEVRKTTFAHVWQLAFQIEEEPIGRSALEAASQLIESAADGRFDQIDDQLENVRKVAEQYRPGPTTRALIAAARKSLIPVYRLDNESLIQLGQGCQQHRLRMAATDRTGHIAEWIARDKLLTKRLLSQAGIPLAEGRQVSDADDACRAASELRASVVVKPSDADFGNGVTVDLHDPSTIRTAYELARRFSSNILVERYVAGYWHRLLVVDGQMIAAVRREPPRVVGDGRRSIRSLIEEYNADPRRGFGDHFAYDPLIVSATVLGVLYRQGYSLESIPAAGTEIRLRQDAYLVRGASQSDVTDHVHPEINELAVIAADTIGLDIAGIDILCEDVSLPIQQQSLVVLEVNAEPALVIHMSPVCEPPRPVAEQIVRSLFPPDNNGRIAVVVVVGDSDLGQELADDLRASGKIVGFVTRTQSRFNSRSIIDGGSSLRSRAQSMFLQRRLEIAVIQLSLTDILNEGLPVECCDLLCLESFPELEQLDRHTTNPDYDRAIDLLLSSGRFARELVANCAHSSVQSRLRKPAPRFALASSERQPSTSFPADRENSSQCERPLNEDYESYDSDLPFATICREKIRELLSADQTHHRTTIDG